LTISNYIFTVVFALEMFVKVSFKTQYKRDSINVYNYFIRYIPVSTSHQEL